MRHRVAQRTLALFVFFAASAARAHGPAPAVLEVLDQRDGIPTLLRTNIGLARAAGDGTYTYLCPSLWDGNENALAAAAEDALGVFSRGAAFVSTDGGDTFERVQEGTVRQVFEGPDGALRVMRHEGMDSVFSDRTGAPVHTFAGHLVDDVHVADGRLLATGSRPFAFVAIHEPSGWRVLGDLDGPASRIVIADVNEDTAMLVATSDERFVWPVTGLFSLPRRTETGPYETVLGPVFDAGWFASLDGQRTSFGGGVWLDDGPVAWTALHRGRRGVVWAMRFGDVRRVDDDSHVFGFSQLAPPSDPACGADWAHFGGESGWLDSDPATSPGGTRTPRQVPSGCASFPGAGREGWLFAVCLLALRRRAR